MTLIECRFFSVWQPMYHVQWDDRIYHVLWGVLNLLNNKEIKVLLHVKRKEII
jgi:hypothetical protein